MTTAIEWTDETWNPTTGCDRISPGCDNCYALTLAKRLKGMGSAKYQNDGDERTSGPGFKLTMHDDTLAAPLRWRKPRKVFVNSMSDLFHQDVTDEFIAKVFAVMALTPQHTYQVLTKRPQRMAALLTGQAPSGPFWRQVRDAMTDLASTDEIIERAGLIRPPLPNVWLGTSIETDRYAFRADHLRATPAAVRFVSAEPLLGPLPSLDLEGIDWLIVGGESGPGARPVDPAWVRDLRDRCMDVTTGAPDQFGTSFFFKQWGAWAPVAMAIGRLAKSETYVGEPADEHGCRQVMRLVGKHDAGRELDGRTWDEYPTADTEAHV